MRNLLAHLAILDALAVRHAVLAVTRSDLADPEPVRADAVERRDIVAEPGTLTTLATAVGQAVERTKMQDVQHALAAAAASSPSTELSAVVCSRCRIHDGGGTALDPRRPFLPGDVAHPGASPAG
ncbi:hypothetical protein ACWGQ5_30370 [Streptomyces sp. NPDC055722]